MKHIYHKWREQGKKTVWNHYYHLKTRRISKTVCDIACIVRYLILFPYGYVGKLFLGFSVEPPICGKGPPNFDANPSTSALMLTAFVLHMANRMNNSINCGRYRRRSVARDISE